VDFGDRTSDGAILYTIFGSDCRQCHRGVLSRSLNTNWEEKLSITIRKTRRCHSNLAESLKMRFVSTALVMMAIALMMLATTFLITPSGP